MILTITSSIISWSLKMVQKMVPVVTSFRCRTGCFTLPTQFTLQCTFTQFILHCSELHCFILVLHNTICAALHSSALLYTVMHCIVFYCSTLWCIEVYCSALLYAAVWQCSMLQFFLPCNVLHRKKIITSMKSTEKNTLHDLLWTACWNTKSTITFLNALQMAEIFNIIQFSTNYLVHQGHCWLLG